jgi:hypothetical protein
VLAAWHHAGLTDGDGSKTTPAPRSKRGMTTERMPTAGASPPGPADVVTWRTRRLLDGAFPPGLAQSLANQPVDLHALLQLVDAGCPPGLAARILSPDDDIGGSR